MAGARAAIAYQKEHLGDRQQQQRNVATVKTDLLAIGIPVIPNPSHIVPLLVGNAEQAKAASDLLLTKHKLYVQSISTLSFLFFPLTSFPSFLSPSPRRSVLTSLLSLADFPTVSIGSERLRITPSPLHSKEQLETLVNALDDVWNELGLKRSKEFEGRKELAGKPKNLWTEEQLGLENVGELLFSFFTLPSPLPGRCGLWRQMRGARLEKGDVRC